jgi:hypothetical protein
VRFRLETHAKEMSSVTSQLSILVVAVYWSSIAVAVVRHRLLQTQEHRGVHCGDNLEEPAQYMAQHAASDELTPIRHDEHNSVRTIRSSHGLTFERQKPSDKRRSQDCNAAHRFNRTRTEKRRRRRDNKITSFDRALRQCPPVTRRSASLRHDCQRALDSGLRRVPSAYPYGKKPIRVLEYYSKSGRPIEPTWKVIDSQITKAILLGLPLIQ